MPDDIRLLSIIERQILKFQELFEDELYIYLHATSGGFEVAVDDPGDFLVWDIIKFDGNDVWVGNLGAVIHYLLLFKIIVENGDCYKTTNGCAIFIV